MPLIWSVFLTLIIIEAFLLIFCRTEIRRTGYEISEQIGRNRILKKEGKKLQVELVILKSPERISEIANKMGLMMPKQSQIKKMP